MTYSHPAPDITPGLAMIHSNRMEDLRDLLIHWYRQHPLPPFERETILAQSNGITQWLKQGLAGDAGLGICAGVSFDLPARFLWQVYRMVLTDHFIPETSPFDRDPLTWRIYQQLPHLIDRDPPLYAPLQRFLAHDHQQQKRYQLASQLAALYDQYQVHRPDWLQSWKEGADTLIQAGRQGEPLPLPEDQAWQSHLWRALFEHMPEPAWTVSRVWLNEHLIERLKSASPISVRLPRRLIIFGISSLPRETLRAITALGQVMQVLFFVQNPCQYYWADLIEGRELLAHEARRQKHKPHFPQNIAEEKLHLHGNPLLAAWGKQGRDFVRLLDEWDQPQNYSDWFNKIDHYVVNESPRLLQQVQNAVLDLQPLPLSPEQPGELEPTDDSILFHVAHSPQREVEILHDQLLHLFDQPDPQADRCEPRDVIVMVPDIDRYAPHIEAVFGQTAPNDERHIPYSLADRRERGHNPISVALDYLLSLPEVRVTATEVLNLLDLAAIRQPLGLETADIPLLRRWIEESGIRWGLDGEHRKTLLNDMELAGNTWQFGLDRLLLGYCMGDGAVYDDRIAPYAGLGGIESDRLGPLCQLLQRLHHYRQVLAQPVSPGVWGERLRTLLADFFSPTDAAERQSLDHLHEALDIWLGHCAAAGLTEAIPVRVVREAWLEGIDQPRLTQRFLAGRVNFCTLMPMRSIPFKVIGLLGMNDGDFPRRQPQPGFDLMARPGAYRPGDRARHEDDRYLFLEALLSARERLHISWVGRSIRDDSPLPPSVLVQQLRDYLKAGWTLSVDAAGKPTDLLTRLTVEHPLQPFSPAYFRGENDARLFSYTHEWLARPPVMPQPSLSNPLAEPGVLRLSELQGFYDKPVRHFFNRRLGVVFEEEKQTARDDERFEFDHLEKYLLGSEYLRMKLRDLTAGENEAAGFEVYLQKQALQGDLPLGSFGTLTQKTQREQTEQVAARYQKLLKKWPVAVEKPKATGVITCDLPNGEKIRLEDWLTGFRQSAENADDYALIIPRPSGLFVDNELKYHYLTKLWVQHVLAHAAGIRLTSWLVGEDGFICLDPLKTEDARRWLDALVKAWYSGLQAPLPVARKTAFAWLKAKKDEKKVARQAYEGGYERPGEVGYDACLHRAYPTADDLLSARVDGKGFVDWTCLLYQPLFTTARRHTGDLS